MVAKSYLGKTPDDYPVFRIGSGIYKESSNQLTKLYDEEVESLFTEDHIFYKSDDSEPTGYEAGLIDQWDALETQLYGSEKF